MVKTKFLPEIQKRLPDDLIVQDETKFEFTEDECISILCWIKYLNKHYEKHGKNDIPDVIFPIISKRLRMDFGLYNIPNNLETNFGKFVIYISQNGQLLNGTFKKNLTLKSLITTWNL